MSRAVTMGQGPHHVICLNGWFGHAAGWGPFVNHLNNDDFTWHFFEYRGYGARRSEPGEHTINEISQDICAYIEQIDGEKVSLLGHSMGGSYMQRVFIDSPVPIASMIGVSPTPASGTHFDEDTRRLFEAAGHSSEARATIIDMTTGNRLSKEWISHMVSESLVNSETAAVEKYFRAWADCDFADEISGDEVPVFVIVGSHDPAVSTGVIEESYSPIYPELHVREFGDAGHYSMFETPLDLQAEVEKFLYSIP